MTTVYEVVQQICLGLPETEELVSHGRPLFKVANKSFASYSVNHHGDGKVALLLNADKERQQMLVDSAPRQFFVPPYLGPQGWLGVELNQGLSWQRISELAFDAYQKTAPSALVDVSEPVQVKPPSQLLTPEEIDPGQSEKNLAILHMLDKICLALPEVSQHRQFGNPTFKAGKKSFCTLSHPRGKTLLQIWVGAEQQAELTTFDQRYTVPAYVGHNGWIDFNLSHKQDWPEIERLVLSSYRHFALKRMLAQL